jgi:hypothetical protein
MKLQISKNVVHSCEPSIKFAYQFTQAACRRMGKKPISKTTVQVRAGRSYPASWTERGQSPRGYWGRAYKGRNLVILHLCPSLPPHVHEYARYKNMPNFVINGGSESIVYLAAHEFGHILGWPGDKAGEIACCKFGYEAVMAWRERQYSCPTALI